MLQLLKMNADIEEFITSEGGRRYDIQYACFDRAEFMCTLRFGLHLWRSPELKWRKSCGGDARPDLAIESSLARYADVFAHGHPSAAWTMMQPEVKLLPEEDDVSFTVRQQGSEAGAAMVLRMPEVWSSNTEVLNVSIANAAQVAGRVLAGDRDGALLLVHHNCKKYGDAIVTVRVPTEDWATELGATLGDRKMFGPVSFSYHKSCGQHGFMLAGIVGQLGILSLMCATCAVVMQCNPGRQNEIDELL